MSAEPIAKVVEDLVHRRVRLLHNRADPAAGRDLQRVALKRIEDPVVVDATSILRSVEESPRDIALYEDHPCITPPWPECAICYVNDHGNVVVMHTRSYDLSDASTAEMAEMTWVATEHPVDWDRVKWAAYSFIYVGGQGDGGKPFPTTGPMHLWRSAIYEDGEPADLNWVLLVDSYPMENWDMAHCTLLGALNFLNCKNVEAVVPTRPRAERRRIERTGIEVHTINVRPIGRNTRGRAPGYSEGVPLTSVRGHFSCYGPKYGRGLLFGRHEGRYWIPQHARGEAEMGEVETDYKLVPQ